MRREMYPTKPNNVNTQKLDEHVKQVQKVEAQSLKGLIVNLLVVLVCIFGLVFMYNNINKQNENAQSGTDRSSQKSPLNLPMKTATKSNTKSNTKNN